MVGRRPGAVTVLAMSCPSPGCVATARVGVSPGHCFRDPSHLWHRPHPLSVTL